MNINEKRELLRQVKDEIAKENGFEDFEDVIYRHSELLFINDIAINYAEQLVLKLEEKRWISIENEHPICAISGDWDGLKSDKVLVKDKYGKVHIALCYEIIHKGKTCIEWTDADGFFGIDNAVSWCKIPY